MSGLVLGREHPGRSTQHQSTRVDIDPLSALKMLGAAPGVLPAQPDRGNENAGDHLRRPVKDVKALASSIRDFWFDHLWIDPLIVPANVWGGHLATVLFTGRLDILAVASLDERRGLY